MRFTVLIPARLASTRRPDKPLADIAGKPMVVRVAERAALSGAARVVVAADHASIVAACGKHGVQAVMRSGNWSSSMICSRTRLVRGTSAVGMSQ